MDNFSRRLKNFINSRYFPFLLLFFLIAITYGFAINNDFLSDDLAGIVENPHTKSLTAPLLDPFNFVIPLANSVTYRLTGLVPWSFRLTNYLFHFGASVFVYLILKMFLRKKTALPLACLFAVHPLLTESVVWISGGSYAGYTFFLLSSLYFYLNMSRKKWYYPFSVFLFLIGIITGIKSIIFPGVLFVAEVSLTRRKNWLKLIPYFLISLIFAFHFYGSIGQRIQTLNTAYYQPTVLANPFYQVPIAIGSYLQLFFWPNNLTFYHSEYPFTFLEQLPFIIAALLLFFLTIYFFFKNRPAFFALSLFLISLIPNLLPIGIAWLVAERYVYFGVFGLVFLLGILIEKNAAKKIPLTQLWLLLYILLLPLGIKTIFRNLEWKNQDNLWVATARYSPSDPKTHNNMGDVYFRHGDYENAVREFQKAIDLNPRYADAFHNLANTYMLMGKSGLAKADYLKAFSINPQLWQSCQNLAAIAYNEKKYPEAISYLHTAININPNIPDLYLNLGIIEYQTNNLSAAKTAFETVLKIDPENPKAAQLLSKIK